MMKYIVLLILLAPLSIQAESQSYSAPPEIIDFLDLKVGEKTTYNFETTSPNDYRSKLPYHFFDVPLPKESIFKPITHFSVSINKETTVLHSKTLELPLTAKVCTRELQRYKSIFTEHGYIKTTQIPSSIGSSQHALINQSQVLTMACESSGSSPFRLLRIEVTTIQEHNKFENIMRNFRG